MTAILRFSEVAYVRDRRSILASVDWEVHAGERWVVLGPNGAGKSTLLRLASTYALPTRGRVEVLGRRVGGADLRSLRAEIGLVSPGLASALAPGIRVVDAVVTGTDATLRRFRQEYTPEEWERSRDLLDLVGCAHLADGRFGRLSDGERQRVLLARALAADPRLLLLDEPGANLDLAGREHLLGALTEVASGALEAAVLVTHHLEEIPTGFTHVLLVSDGEIVAKGPLRETLLSDAVAECFGVDVTVREDRGRFTATTTAPAVGSHPERR